MAPDEGNVLEYEEMGVHSTLARFGILRTPTGRYELPAMSPGIRTEVDARAVLQTMRGGVPVHVISPYLSWGRSLPRNLQAELFSPESMVRMRTPLVLPDPESEAFSFNCSARTRFAKMHGTTEGVLDLMRCSLSRGPRREEVYSHWQDHRDSYGFAALEAWLETRYSEVGSRVFLAIGPIIRASHRSIREAFDIEKTILMDEVGKHEFPLFGAHFILHSELVNRSEASKAALGLFYDGLDKLLGARSVPRLIASFKFYDGSSSLQDPQSGSPRRRALSEFVSEATERVRRHGGAIIGHDFGNLGLGILDSGADVASFKVSGIGPLRIEMPVQPSSLGPRSTPLLFNHATLSEEPVDVIIPKWRAAKAFPTPTGVNPHPYWDAPFQEQMLYTAHARCAALVEMGREYRAAGLDRTTPLSEALRNRVLRSEVRQQLLDLCPSLGGL